MRGNRIAAVGMAVAVDRDAADPGLDNWGLIVLGVAIGTAVGVPAARKVKMTQMPQMVALFNGVGGGAVALIAWVEFRESDGFADVATYVAIFSVFAVIVGSVSFWGSNIAFAKLQELISGRPITRSAHATRLTRSCSPIAVGCGAGHAAAHRDEQQQRVDRRLQPPERADRPAADERLQLGERDVRAPEGHRADDRRKQEKIAT